jgi:NAD-dependent protein deacetylase/lipoamidase
MRRIVVLSGAGMSAESGINTFRGAGGLWEGHDVMEVASLEGWNTNVEFVLDFYNQRRRQLLDVVPNPGHTSLSRLEEKFVVHVVTQNVDDLHERAGSSQVVHLHGELLKVRSSIYPDLSYHWTGDLHVGDLCDRGAQLRPDIVWFGEAVPALQEAAALVHDADITIIIGTSMQVYPAAGLIAYAQQHCVVYYIDPKPSINHELVTRHGLTIIAETAGNGVPVLVTKLLENEHARGNFEGTL